MGNCVGGKGGKKDPKQLSDEEVKLLLQNTSLNIGQINTLHANFLKECPTGKLTKKDFIKLFKEVHPSDNKKEKADKFCEYVFKVIDKDNLGYITFQDFVLCFSLTSYGDFKQKCEFAFKLYDLDKDGKISKKEMTQVLEALYDLSGITNRKGDNAPSKKVDDIMKKINQDVSADPASNASTLSKEDKKKDGKSSKQSAGNKDAKKDKDNKKEKAAKEQKTAAAAKPKDFITKEQFIEACSTDESIKKLFLDSIYASPDDAGINIKAPSLNVKAPSVNVKGASFDVKAPSVDVKAPSIDVKAPSVDVKAPSVDVKAPSVDVKAPSVDFKLPSVDVKAPSVDINAPSACFAPPKISACPPIIVNSRTEISTSDVVFNAPQANEVFSSSTFVDLNNNDSNSPIVSSTSISVPDVEVAIHHEDERKNEQSQVHAEPVVVEEHEKKDDKHAESHVSSSSPVVANEQSDNKPNSNNDSEEKKF